jgi:hypothetical protein
MILRDEELYLLETNTIPGMTPTSLLPQAAAEAGIPFCGAAGSVDRSWPWKNQPGWWREIQAAAADAGTAASTAGKYSKRVSK